MNERSHKQCIMIQLHQSIRLLEPRENVGKTHAIETTVGLCRFMTHEIACSINGNSVNI